MAAWRVLAAALFGLLALVATANAGGTGDGTAYSAPHDKDATGFNSCGFGKLEDRWEIMYAALPSDSFDREAHCGKCIRVKGLEAGASGNWVVVKVVDECASCSGGDVDFSTAALEAITGFNWDRKKITWEFCPCSGASTDTEEAVDEPAPEQDSSDSSDSGNEEQQQQQQDDSEEDIPLEEADLNGNGKLSKKEKRKWRKAQREEEEGSRKLLRA